MEETKRFALFYQEGQPLPRSDQDQINQANGIMVVSETPTRLVVETMPRTLNAILENLPGWEAFPVTVAHIPTTLPKTRSGRVKTYKDWANDPKNAQATAAVRRDRREKGGP